MVDTRRHIKEADRPSLEFPPEVTESVSEILADVRRNGDEAIREFTREFDGVERESIRVSQEEIAAAHSVLEEEDRKAIDETIANVRAFHEEQLEHLEGMETHRSGVKFVRAPSCGPSRAENANDRIACYCLAHPFDRPTVG
ncbi:histidinol dehydrogenase [Natronobeatus ordinarius]|uniref:histidinol dehydrogenase n=1 Tax=Natronobeatus ordinarius TaxID=2963433 RepID=UPI0020CF2766|nr:histidinol dehydrogenase [Natronobeatus ordinarius]